MAKRTALLASWEKDDQLVNLATQLVDEFDFDLLGSSGTATFLQNNTLPCRDIAEIVGPPIMGHRVVTLSREIHAALLATESPEDQAELDRLGIPRIDLVYVTLYPLAEEIRREGATLESVIEKTDIGGPTLLRSAAKGRRVVVCRSSEIPVTYKILQGKYDQDPQTKEDLISGLASIAEDLAANYCQISGKFLAERAKATWFRESGYSE